jgi:CRP/FNR family cyclic AMP-dependent transcriptional regulator
MLRPMANRRDHLEQLSAVPLFRSSSKRELEKIARAADEVTVEAGRVLVTEGEIGRECYVIVSGEAVVSRDGVEIARLGAGQPIGELAVLDGGRRTATVVAATDLDLLVIGQREFSALLSEVPGLAHKVMVYLAERVRQLDERVYG